MTDRASHSFVNRDDMHHVDISAIERGEARGDVGHYNQVRDHFVSYNNS